MRRVAGIAAAALVLALGVRSAAAQGVDGQATYREQCRTCHGTDGHPTKRALGEYKKIPTFDATFLAARSPDSVAAVVRHGLGKDMKAFKDKLSAEEIQAVAKYVKETFGKDGAPKE